MIKVIDMSTSLIEKIEFLHAFFQDKPEIVPTAGNRIGLNLDKQGQLKPLPKDDVFAMQNIQLNWREVNALYTYIHVYMQQMLDKKTCVTTICEGRGVTVTNDMLKHELTTIQWMGTNVGHAFANQLEVLK